MVLFNNFGEFCHYFTIIRKLLTNIGLLVLLNLLVKPAWLYVDFLVQDKLNHVNYGQYAALFSLSYLFINLADFGVNIYVTRRLTVDKENFKSLYSNAFGFKLLACLVYPVLVTSIGYLIGYKNESLYFLFILGLVQSILQTIAFFRANFQALHFFNIDSTISISDRVILLLITLILFATGITLFLFIHAILLSVILTGIISLLLLTKVQGWIAPRLEKTEVKSLLVNSFPFALIGLLYAINQKVDMVMVERLGGVQGAENAGLYAAAYRWMDAFMMYLWTTLPIFFAKFSTHQYEPEENQKLFNLGQIISFIPTLFIGVVVLFYGQNLFWMFKNSSLKELEMMTQILKILFVSLIVQGMFAIYGTFLNSTGHEKSVSWMIVICLIINISLNLIYIPIYGPIAAAYISLLCTTIICIMYLIYFQRNTQIQIPMKILLQLVSMAALFVTVFYFLTFTTFNWLIVSGISGVCLLIIAYIINVGNIQSVLKEK